MFTSSCNSLPISNQRHGQKHISSKSKSTWSAPWGSSSGGLHGIHFSGQCIINYVSSLSHIVWRISMTSVLSTLFTVWCILLQIALDCGFLLVEHTYLMLKIPNSHWNFCPMNSPPLSCKHHTGWVHQHSQIWVNLSRMCSPVLLSTWMSPTKFQAVSMQVNELNSTYWPFTLTFHNPIKLMVTSSQGTFRTSHLGRRLWTRPANLYFWQSLHFSLSLW